MIIDRAREHPGIVLEGEPLSHEDKIEIISAMTKLSTKLGTPAVFTRDLHRPDKELPAREISEKYLRKIPLFATTYLKLPSTRGTISIGTSLQYPVFFISERETEINPLDRIVAQEVKRLPGVTFYELSETLYQYVPLEQTRSFVFQERYTIHDFLGKECEQIAHRTGKKQIKEMQAIGDNLHTIITYILHNPDVKRVQKIYNKTNHTSNLTILQKTLEVFNEFKQPLYQQYPDISEFSDEILERYVKLKSLEMS